MCVDGLVPWLMALLSKFHIFRKGSGTVVRISKCLNSIIEKCERGTMKRYQNDVGMIEESCRWTNAGVNLLPDPFQKLHSANCLPAALSWMDQGYGSPQAGIHGFYLHQELYHEATGRLEYLLKMNFSAWRTRRVGKVRRQKASTLTVRFTYSVWLCLLSMRHFVRVFWFLISLRVFFGYFLESGWWSKWARRTPSLGVKQGQRLGADQSRPHGDPNGVRSAATAAAGYEAPDSNEESYFNRHPLLLRSEASYNGGHTYEAPHVRRLAHFILALCSPCFFSIFCWKI